jgi:hypothetical protein
LTSIHVFFSNLFMARLGRNFVLPSAGQIAAGGSRSRWNAPAVLWQRGHPCRNDYTVQDGGLISATGLLALSAVARAAMASLPNRELMFVYARSGWHLCELGGYHVELDPRVGSISIVGIISTLSGRSGLLSYCIACALILITGSLGLAGIVAGTASEFFIVVAKAEKSLCSKICAAGDGKHR